MALILSPSFFLAYQPLDGSIPGLPVCLFLPTALTLPPTPLIILGFPIFGWLFYFLSLSLSPASQTSSLPSSIFSHSWTTLHLHKLAPHIPPNTYSMFVVVVCFWSLLVFQLPQKSTLICFYFPDNFRILLMCFNGNSTLLYPTLHHNTSIHSNPQPSSCIIFPYFLLWSMVCVEFRCVCVCSGVTSHTPIHLE